MMHNLEVKSIHSVSIRKVKHLEVSSDIEKNSRSEERDIYA